MNSSRAPPPTGGPRSARMVGRLYRGDLRGILVGMAAVGAVWSLFWTVGSFEDISTDKQFGSPKLGTLDIVLGAIFAATAAIEIFGIGAAAMRRVSLVQMYTLLSIVATALVVGSQILLFVLHFVFKSALINECEQLSQNTTIVERIGVWGPLVTDQLDSDQINSACNDLWNRDSISGFVWIVVVGFYAVFTATLAYAYLHQLRDPASIVNATRAPSSQLRAGAGGDYPYPSSSYPTHYNPPYAAPNLPYGAGPYAAPAGAPPPNNYSTASVPGYEGYEVEGGKKVPGYGVGADKGDDPFADFDRVRRNGSDETLTESQARGQGSKFDV